MNLEALIKKHGGLVKAMQALIEQAQKDDRDLNDDEQKSYDELEAQAVTLETQIERQKSLEARSAKFAAPVAGGNDPAKGAKPVQRSYGEVMAKWKMGGDPVNLFARQAIAMYHGGNRFGAAQYAKDTMGDEVLAAMLTMGPEAVVRAAVAQSTTTDPTSAAPLVAIREAAEQFIEMLRPRSVFARIGAGGELTFGTDGAIKIPRQTGGTSGGWVGEGKPIKVNRLQLGSLSLSPKKLAVIAFTTQELMDHSNPSMQSLLTRDLLAGAAQTIDGTFIDKIAASAIRPAGLQTYGTSAASAGATLANVITDIKAAKGALVMANVTMEQPVWIMSETTRIALELLQDSVGQDAFPEIINGTWRGYPILSSNTVGDVIILLDAAHLIKAMDLAPVIDSSNDATINADDDPTDPDISKSGSVTTPVYSMFQTDQVAIRMRQRLDWGMRNAVAVFTLTGVKY